MTENKPPSNEEPTKRKHFIEQLIENDLESGKITKVVTRFPPEPNGYLHIGHAKSICLNFGMAEKFGGDCQLRFDDTNPAKEDQEFVESIQEDIRWLGFQWTGDVRYTSNYFDQLYQWAIELIKNGDAYVCDLSADEAREYRGTLKEPGKNSPYRERTVEENLSLLEKMRTGELEEGSCSLRAKIDMSSPNINLRDPIMYRIKKATHHQTGDKWSIYPSYDFAHGQSDSIEGVTHSLCTLEFEDHRPLYEWFLSHLDTPASPKQTEFSRLNPNYTITSKRKLKQLVDENHVEGWDDPRMPTISGLRRRGYTPASIRNFCEAAGVTRSLGVTDASMLEYEIRDDLDKNAPRAMCVLNPIKLVLTNYPDNKEEFVTAPGHPNRDDLGVRRLPFSKEIYIEAEDFREEANKKYKRLVLGKKVRLRNAYVVQAESVVKDSEGNVTEVHCSCDMDTLGNNPADGVKPKGVIHWVSAKNNLKCQVRLYDRLFTEEAPDAGGKDFLQSINPESLKIVDDCYAEVSLKSATVNDRFQFEREGYFCLDSQHTSQELPVFNRTIGLRDSWGKKESNG
ncbi:MAG: glutamine--tRNA ligase/YqeY domain fusion protein [Cellvibrionaceae bacterium]